MKKLFAIFSFLLTCLCFGQQLDIKMESVKYRQNKGSYFTDWSVEKQTSVLVTIDSDKLKMIVYSNPQETYTAFDAKPTRHIDNAIVQDWHCVDSKGKRCTVTLVISKVQNLIMINLRYNNWEYIYSGYLLL